LLHHVNESVWVGIDVVRVSLVLVVRSEQRLLLGIVMLVKTFIPEVPEKTHGKKDVYPSCCPLNHELQGIYGLGSLSLIWAKAHLRISSPEAGLIYSSTNLLAARFQSFLVD